MDKLLESFITLRRKGGFTQIGFWLLLIVLWVIVKDYFVVNYTDFETGKLDLNTLGWIVYYLPTMLFGWAIYYNYQAGKVIKDEDAENVG